MQPNTLSPLACLRFGWNTFKTRPWFFIGISLLVCVIDIIIRAVTAHDKDTGAFLTLIDVLASAAFGTVLSMGLVSFMLKAHDAPMAAVLKDLWPNLNRFWKYLGTVILMIIVIGVGFILLIIPGLIAITVFAFAYYPVIERSLGPITAMKESARITKGHRWSIFGLLLLLIVLNIVGLIALVVGLLVTIPITMFAIIHAYRLLSANQAAPIVVAEPASPVTAAV